MRGYASSQALCAFTPPSPQGGHDDEAEDGERQRIFERVVDLAVPLLDPLAGEMNFVDPPEQLVEHADLLAFHVLGRGSLDDVVADPAVHRSHEAEFHRPLDVAEQ